MKKRRILYILIILILIAAGYIIIRPTTGSSKTGYQFTTISRGNIENTISSTGTLNPTTTIDISTQVSGIIDSVYIDFNDLVKSGQILVVLDTVVLKAAVLEAEANIERAKALLEQAEYNKNLNKNLYDKGMISESDYFPFTIDVKTQKASLKSAQIALDKAKRNLEYAVIRSPIDGVVIGKNIETGQTVAASLSAPILLQIAHDLSLMEILVDVDESDIGEIKKGQRVRFEVPAYSEKQFEGVVQQVRMQAETISNVVTYTVVVEAENKDNLLLPGMTATVDFIIEQKSDVLMISGKALRYRPDSETMNRLTESRKQQRASEQNLRTDQQIDSSRTTRAGKAPTSGLRKGTGERPKDMATLFYLNDDGQLTMEIIRTGISDGTNTEIVKYRNLTEGMQIIYADGGSGSSSSSTGNSASSGFGHRPRGF